MKPKHILFLAYVNLKRRKKQAVLGILLMTFALSVFIITLAFSSAMTNFINKSIINSVDGRTLFVDYNYKQFSQSKIIDLLSKYKHVVAAVPEADTGTIITAPELVNKAGNNDGEVRLKGGNPKAVPNIIEGRNFKNGESNVAIIPEKFLPDSKIESLKGMDNQTFIDGKSLIGKKITGQYKVENPKGEATNFTYTFTVIGVYDSSQSMDYESVCYVPFEDVNKMTSAIFANFKDPNANYPVVIVVDNYKNMKPVMEQLAKDGMRSDAKVHTNTSISQFIDIIGGTLSLIIFIVGLINISLTTLNSIKDKTQEIGLLKSIGYNNRVILTMLNTETALMGIIGFVLASLISLGVVLYFSWYLGTKADFNSAKLTLNLNLLTLLSALGISVLVPALGCLSAGMKVLRIQPSSAIKE